FVILRVLFDLEDEGSYQRDIPLRGTWPESPKDARRIPRFPILLWDDMPLLVVGGNCTKGARLPVERHGNYFRDHGRIRPAPLCPTNKLLQKLECFPMHLGLLDSSIGTSRDQRRISEIISGQLIRLAESASGNRRSVGMPSWELVCDSKSW